MESIAFVVSESSQVSEARRWVSRLATDLGFSDSDVGRAALVATEVTTNLVKHSPEGGRLLVRSLEAGTIHGGEQGREQVGKRCSVRGIELLVLDSGPGIANVSRALSDGYSTAGSPGTGLGAVARLADRFDLHSAKGEGTALLVEIWPARAGAPGPGVSGLVTGGVRVPHPKEKACGDAWAYSESRGRWLGLVVDGLGHGLLASEASEQAVRTFERAGRMPVEKLMESIHLSMRSGRGGVAALAEVDVEAGRLDYVGVGNITGVLCSSTGMKNLVSHNGTLGQDVRRFRSFSYPWSPDSVLIMHSDGIRNRWDLRSRPGLFQKPPSLIAGVLYRDYNRGRDDSALLVTKAGGT